MARDRGVAMTDAEVAELLEAQRTVTLATIGPDGRPHLASMWFARDGADLLMWTYAVSQKARNIERDPRVTVLAESGHDYAELRGVSLDCVVEPVTGVGEVLEIGTLLHRRNTGAGLDDDGVERLRAQAAKRVGLRLRVERVRSWDHRKLARL